MASSLLELRGVSRYYQGFGVEVKALHRVDLRVDKGEFVAIMGQSGSGKSTLMNILGCLDTPTAGKYLVNAQNVAELADDSLSALRLKTFGFVFQRYQLLTNISAKENVALPAIYAGLEQQARTERAKTLLAKFGLAERAEHKPAELSGGQQQRVSVARALINDAEVILADEPTGALDSKSGAQLLALLKTLNEEGMTVILITHDPEVASHAGRQVVVEDGQIVSDSGNEADGSSQKLSAVTPFPSISTLAAIGMAVSSLKNNWFRTLLTLLGIIIGVAAVVTMMAIGEGGKQQVLDRIASIGSNLISVRPGGSNIRSEAEVATLSLADAEAVAALPGIAHVAPERSVRATIRFKDRDFSGRITGTTPAYQRVKDWQLAQGVFFNEDDLKHFAPVVVLGNTVATELFGSQGLAIGEYVLMKNAFYQVIGVLKAKGASAGGNDMDDEVLIPLTTGRLKLFGREHLSAISIKVQRTEAANELAAQVRQRLVSRHGKEDVMVRTTESLVEAVTETQDTLTWQLASVAAISLFVGGIGVMNIMLVNVSERKREIGLRMATGAKSKDILKQFNIEAWMVCIAGGGIGVLLGYVIVFCLSVFGHAVAYTPAPPIIAFLTSLLIGVIFGYAPAHKAARLNPIEALAED